MMYSREIIEMLQGENVKLNKQQINTIELLCYELYQKGKEDGVSKGKKEGKEIAYKNIIKFSNDEIKNLLKD